MGFLLFCCIKLATLIALLFAVMLLVIGSAYVPDWLWGFIIAAVIAYVFLRCWWNEYKQVKRKREELLRDRK